jgi:hypothetical protein
MTDTQTGRRSYYVAAEASLRHGEDLAERARHLLNGSGGKEERFRKEAAALRDLADSFTALSRQALDLARFESEHPEDAMGI